MRLSRAEELHDCSLVHARDLHAAGGRVSAAAAAFKSEHTHVLQKMQTWSINASRARVRNAHDVVVLVICGAPCPFCRIPVEGF